MTVTALRKSLACLLSLVLVFSCTILPKTAVADEGGSFAAGSVNLKKTGTKSITKGSLTVTDLEDFGGLVPRYSRWASLQFTCEREDTIKVTSDNENVVKISDFTRSAYNGNVVLELQKTGLANITLTNGVDSIEVPIVVPSDYATDITSITKTSHDSIAISWKPVSGMSGYMIKRIKEADQTSKPEDYTQLKLVSGESANTAIVNAPWDVGYTYLVLPFVECNGQRFFSEHFRWSSVKSFTLSKPVVKLYSVIKKANTSLALNWSVDTAAPQFDVYRSTSPDRDFKRVATTSAKSWIDTAVKAGVVYYYQVVANFGGGLTATSNTFCKMIPSKSKVLKKLISAKQLFREGEYEWYHASPDMVGYYTQGSKIYVVSYLNNKLKIYGFNSKLKKTSTKTIKLPKHQVWGGYYHGSDGNNYVAIGWNNPKEKKTKTVIKIIKYNNKWKKVKVASIKGKVNKYDDNGIYRPFAAGTTSFDMQGDTLFLHTSREVFKLSDGLHHQSNISFSINTKNMHVEMDYASFVSHSFKQIVRFKDGSYYLMDHGDAGPRGIYLKTRGYGTEYENKVEWSKTLFSFLGDIGENFTGATLGGMEIGVDNVLACGTAQPHKNKIKGVKGFGDYRENVFLTVTNRTTGKTTFKWLTSINPKKGKQILNTVRMVKLSDDRFAILYSTWTAKNWRKCKFYYTVVDGSGKKIMTKTYKNVVFSGAAQPILHDGCIYWTENNFYTYEKTKMYRIPALC